MTRTLGRASLGIALFLSACGTGACGTGAVAADSSARPSQPSSGDAEHPPSSLVSVTTPRVESLRTAIPGDLAQLFCWRPPSVIVSAELTAEAVSVPAHDSRRLEYAAGDDPTQIENMPAMVGYDMKVSAFLSDKGFRATSTGGGTPEMPFGVGDTIRVLLHPVEGAPGVATTGSNDGMVALAPLKPGTYVVAVNTVMPDETPVQVDVSGGSAGVRRVEGDLLKGVHGEVEDRTLSDLKDVIAAHEARTQQVLDNPELMDEVQRGPLWYPTCPPEVAQLAETQFGK